MKYFRVEYRRKDHTPSFIPASTTANLSISCLATDRYRDPPSNELQFNGYETTSDKQYQKAKLPLNFRNTVKNSKIPM
ncbi:hypothetical protein PPNK14_05330 [Pectobacterium parmentieri]